LLNNPLRQHDSHAAARLQQLQAPLDEQDLGLDLVLGVSGQIKQAGDRFALGRVDALLRLRVNRTVLSHVALMHLIRDSYFRFQADIARLHIRAEGRIGQHDVEAIFEDAVDVDEAVVVMHPAVAVAVHDHVHLAGARHAVVRVRAVNALVCQTPQPRTLLSRINRLLQLGVFAA